MAKLSSQMTSPSHRLYALVSMMILIVNTASTHAKPVAIPPPPAVHQEAASGGGGGPIALNPGIHGTVAGVQQAQLPPSLAMAASKISKDDDDGDSERGLSFGVKFGAGRSSHSSSHSSEEHHHHRRSSHHHDRRRGTSSSVVKTVNEQSTYHNDVDPYSGRGTVVKSRTTQVASSTNTRGRHSGGYAPVYNNNGYPAPGYANDQQPYYRGGGYDNNGGRNQWGRGGYH